LHVHSYHINCLGQLIVTTQTQQLFPTKQPSLRQTQPQTAAKPRLWEDDSPTKTNPWEGQSPVKTNPYFKPKWSSQAPVFVPNANIKSNAEVDRTFVDTSKLHSGLQHPGVYPHEDPTTLASQLNLANITSDEEDKENRFDDSNDRRTLLMKGLHKDTTLSDVVSVIRGGQLLKVHLYSKDRWACFSFVHPAAAEAFFLYSKQAVIQVRGRTVSFACSMT
jgi:hypothetical protein